MIPIAERQGLGVRGRLFLRFMQSFLLIAGALAISYVGLTLLMARSCQQAANRALEHQIQAQETRQISPPSPAKEGDVLGRMEIPRLGMTVAVLEGTTQQTLEMGAGHIAGTSLPGEPGNIGIAGHRDTYFRSLKDIHPGDEIRIQSASGLARYQVDRLQIVAPEDVAVLAPSASSAVTLVTCYPFHFIGAAPKRFIVHAHVE